MVSAKLFGSPVRTKVLILAALLEETYPRELARLAEAPLLSVQRIVNDLEREGVLASRIVGANRQVMLNKRFHGIDDLKAFLVKYSRREPNLERTVAGLRRRPRRAGKSI